MKNSIALIGYMGTGKTAVGKTLADRLGKEFVETDALIESLVGKPIPEIFRQDGEIAFRELEIEIIKRIAIKDKAVIACGGGIVLNKINIDRLAEKCIIINLKASPSVIAKRTSGDKDSRPLLAVSDRLAQIKELQKYRKPYYQRAADFEIDTSRLSIEAVVSEIIEKLKSHADYSKQKRT
jgi:shikimate kinase